MWLIIVDKEQNMYLFCICFLEVFIRKLPLDIELGVKTIGKFGLFSQQTVNFIWKVSSLNFVLTPTVPEWLFIQVKL